MRKNFAFLIAAGSLVLAMILSGVLFSRAAVPAPGPTGYHVIKTVSIPGDEGWDYLNVDSDARRVYISHGTHVVVMNADTYAIEGDIPDTLGVHGIAIASDLGRVFTFNGRGKNTTAINAADGTVVGTLALGGKPEFAAADGKGSIFVNNEDT